jgi:hypothetical protein
MFINKRTFLLIFLVATFFFSIVLGMAPRLSKHLRSLSDSEVGKQDNDYILVQSDNPEDSDDDVFVQFNESRLQQCIFCQKFFEKDNTNVSVYAICPACLKQILEQQNDTRSPQHTHDRKFSSSKN